MDGRWSNLSKSTASACCPALSVSAQLSWLSDRKRLRDGLSRCSLWFGTLRHFIISIGQLFLCNHHLSMFICLGGNSRFSFSFQIQYQFHFTPVFSKFYSLGTILSYRLGAFMNSRAVYVGSTQCSFTYKVIEELEEQKSFWRGALRNKDLAMPSVLKRYNFLCWQSKNKRNP